MLEKGGVGGGGREGAKRRQGMVRYVFNVTHFLEEKVRHFNSW